jgi:heterogeneous nuclear rnp K-like protein
VKEEVKEEDEGSIAELRVVMPAVFATPLTRPSYPILQTIQTETTATLTLNQSVLPLSTERLLIIRGSIHAVSKAVQRISEYLQNSYEHYASLQNGAKPPVVWYVPLPVYGSLGAPENYDLPRVIQARMMTPQNPFGIDPKVPLAPQPSAQPQQQVLQQGPTQIPGPMVGGPAGGHGIQAAVVGPGGQMTQQIFIPNDMVGAIIGKGGAKINEIRQMSGSHMYLSDSSYANFSSKINEPAENSNERLVTITGTQDCNQMALYMLYSRLESEKHRM